MSLAWTVARHGWLSLCVNASGLTFLVELFQEGVGTILHGSLLGKPVLSLDYWGLVLAVQAGLTGARLGSDKTVMH